MFWLRRNRTFKLEASATELALSNFLTIYDLLSILDKSTARAVAKRIRQQAVMIDSIVLKANQECITKTGIETIRRLLLEACK